MIVVDTNILAYLLLPNPRAEAAKALYRRNPIWTAPPLWRSELRNLLARYLRMEILERGKAEAITALAAALLAGRPREVPDAMVFGLVARSSCTAYDCEFVGLAAMLGTILVTEDRELLRDFPHLALSLDEALQADFSG
jgi:predicted nucleic acid-binding protein